MQVMNGGRTSSYGAGAATRRNPPSQSSTSAHVGSAERATRFRCSLRFVQCLAKTTDRFFEVVAPRGRATLRKFLPRQIEIALLHAFLFPDASIAFVTASSALPAGG
jgi:hypothetical protein